MRLATACKVAFAIILAFVGTALAQDCPELIGFLATPDYAQGVAVSGAYAFVAASESGLRVIDVSTPENPFEVGFVDTPDVAYGVDVFGSYAYVADLEGGLRVIDVSMPASPFEVGFVDTPGLASGVHVSGHYAYVADGPEGLRVIDVSTPANPVEVGFVNTPNYAHRVDVSDSFAYVADLEGLRVIDISTPANPVEVGFATTKATDVDVSSGYAFVSAETYGFWVLDVSTPESPIEVGFENTSYAHGVDLSGYHAYVADVDRGLRAIDVSTPDTPFEVGFHVTGGAVDLAVSSGYVFMADYFDGLYVFRQCPMQFDSYFPAAAAAAGAEGAFFQTDVDINNKGSDIATVYFQWLPRGGDNIDPLSSPSYELFPGSSLFSPNILVNQFNLEPDVVGAVRMVDNTGNVIGISRTYNLPGGKVAGTFGQALPAVPSDTMLRGTAKNRIIFQTENSDLRTNVGCQNGTPEALRVSIDLHNNQGDLLETRTLDLQPFSNDQINRIFRPHRPVDGYVDVYTASDTASYYCYGSVLDNETSDPTSILPQRPSHDIAFIPAAALAGGAQGSFFQTDLDINNTGTDSVTYRIFWLPRGQDNSSPTQSEMFRLDAGTGIRYSNVLSEIFGAEPDAVGALRVTTFGSTDLISMSRTYNIPQAKIAGTFGQAIPGVPGDQMMMSGERKRIVFMAENDEFRANVGCQNGSFENVRVNIELFNADGESLETKAIDLLPLSNNQISRVFRTYAPVMGYVDVWHDTEGAPVTCYGSVLDNLTSDPTTVMPQ